MFSSNAEYSASKLTLNARVLSRVIPRFAPCNSASPGTKLFLRIVIDCFLNHSPLLPATVVCVETKNYFKLY